MCCERLPVFVDGEPYDVSYAFVATEDGWEMLLEKLETIFLSSPMALKETMEIPGHEKSEHKKLGN
jgi:hypothetical protein